MFEKFKFYYRAKRYQIRLDPAEIQFIREQVKKDSTVVDIGAHKGGYLYWLSKGVGPSGKVFAFEPQPTLFKYLQTTLQSLKLDQVHLEQKGVSSEAGTFDFFIPGDGTSPGATLNQELAQKESGRNISIETVALDEYFKDRTEKINFIKIDVEGHELAVFQGALELLKKDRPILLFECEERHQNGQSILDTFSYLQDLGYQGFFVQNDQIIPIEQFSIEKHQQQYHFKDKSYCNNFIFR